VRTLLFGLIFISPPFLKKLLLRWFCGAKIGYEAQVGWFSAVMARQVELGEHSVIRPLTLIKLNGEVGLGHYSQISSFCLIYGSSSLILDDHSYIGPQCLVNADEEVRLGRESALGPRSMVFTHGSFLPYTEGYWVRLAPVSIGSRVWCAAGVFIHPGVQIGDDTFVNSRSVVTQNIPPGSVVEGNPAQVTYPMERIKRKMSPRRIDAALDHLLHDFAEIGLRRELGVTTIEEEKHQLRFRWRSQDYRIAVVPFADHLPNSVEPVRRERQIFVVNREDWSPPSGALVFDMVKMQTPFASDRIHASLRVFMLRYYGIKFEDERLA
jgi:acetyltransferase-like isoleucine patch superfamily enzyme